MASSISPTDICSHALSRLGAAALVTLTDDSDAARFISSVYPVQRDLLLVMDPWKFATVRAVLAALASAPAFGPTYAFPIPTDCLQPLETDGQDSDQWDVELVASGGSYYRCIVTDSSTCKLKYTARVTDTTLFDPAFVVALEVLLAREASIAILKKQEVWKALDADFNGCLKEARVRNGMQGTPGEFVCTTLTTDARDGGSTWDANGRPTF